MLNTFSSTPRHPLKKQLRIIFSAWDSPIPLCSAWCSRKALWARVVPEHCQVGAPCTRRVQMTRPG